MRDWESMFSISDWTPAGKKLPLLYQNTKYTMGCSNQIVTGTILVFCSTSDSEMNEVQRQRRATAKLKTSESTLTPLQRIFDTNPTPRLPPGQITTTSSN